MTSDSHSTEKFSKLSTGQIDVLREIARYKTSKEIARSLNISPHTVDKRIGRIMAILEVTSRANAARRYIDCCGADGRDHRQLYENLVYQSSSLSGDDIPAYQAVSANERNPVDDGEIPALHEAQAQYFAGSFEHVQDHSWWSVLSKASHRNDLTGIQRSVVIFVIMILAIMALSMMVSVVEGLSRFV